MGLVLPAGSFSEQFPIGFHTVGQEGACAIEGLGVTTPADTSNIVGSANASRRANDKHRGMRVFAVPPIATVPLPEGPSPPPV